MSFLYVLYLILVSLGISSGDPGVVPLNNFLLPIEQLSHKLYKFGYEFADGLGMKQQRQEVADGTGAVRGSYGYLDPLGVNRIVEYLADADGYKAVVRSNEPGMDNQNTADALFVVQPPPAAAIAQGFRPTPPKFIL